MDITLKQLQIFRAVVVSGSITKASRRLVLSQPSISQQLAKLEERLGAQLILRNRTGTVSLTPAGAYWYGVSDELTRRLEAVGAEHRARFVDSTVALRMGITPTLRGRFIAKAARIAAEEPGFVKFEMRYALTSAELVEQLHLHQLNCVLVNYDAIVDERGSFAVSEVFNDPIAFVTPVELPQAELERAIANPAEALDGALGRYVEVDASMPLRGKTDHWYRHVLPAARPMFTATTYPAAIELCAEGLATTHCPLSLLPNLPPSTMAKLRFYEIEDMARTMVLVMPKHLLTLPAYARVFRGIEEFCRTEYASEMQPETLHRLPLPKVDTTVSQPAD